MRLHWLRLNFPHTRRLLLRYYCLILVGSRDAFAILRTVSRSVLLECLLPDVLVGNYRCVFLFGRFRVFCHMHCCVVCNRFFSFRFRWLPATTSPILNVCLKCYAFVDASCVFVSVVIVLLHICILYMNTIAGDDGTDTHTGDRGCVCVQLVTCVLCLSHQACR